MQCSKSSDKSFLNLILKNPQQARMKLLALFCLALAAPATPLTWKSGDGGLVSWQRNCQLSTGEKLTTIPSFSENCGGHCVQNPQCDSFTWNNGQCTLTKGCATGKGQLTGNKGSMCGFIRSRVPQSQQATLTASLEAHKNIISSGAEAKGKLVSQMTWKNVGEVSSWQTDCQLWADSKLTTMPSFSDNCWKLCVQNPQCDSFTWDNGQCTLMKGCTSDDCRAAEKKGAVCGIIQSRIPKEPVPVRQPAQSVTKVETMRQNLKRWMKQQLARTPQEQRKTLSRNLERWMKQTMRQVSLGARKPAAIRPAPKTIRRIPESRQKAMRRWMKHTMRAVIRRRIPFFFRRTQGSRRLAPLFRRRRRPSMRWIKRMLRSKGRWIKRLLRSKRRRLCSCGAPNQTNWIRRMLNNIYINRPTITSKSSC